MRACYEMDITKCESTVGFWACSIALRFRRTLQKLNPHRELPSALSLYLYRASRNNFAACSTQLCEWNLHTDDLRRIERRYHELPRDSCSFCLMKAAGSGRVNDEARVTSSPSLVDTFTQYKVVRTPWSFLPLW